MTLFIRVSFNETVADQICSPNRDDVVVLMEDAVLRPFNVDATIRRSAEDVISRNRAAIDTDMSDEAIVRAIFEHDKVVVI